MIAACAEEKSCEELVQRKGWGLPSLIENINRAPRGRPVDVLDACQMQTSPDSS